MSEPPLLDEKTKKTTFIGVGGQIVPHVLSQALVQSATGVEGAHELRQVLLQVLRQLAESGSIMLTRIYK